MISATHMWYLAPARWLWVPCQVKLTTIASHLPGDHSAIPPQLASTKDTHAPVLHRHARKQRHVAPAHRSAPQHWQRAGVSHQAAPACAARSPQRGHPDGHPLLLHFLPADALLAVLPAHVDVALPAQLLLHAQVGAQRALRLARHRAQRGQPVGQRAVQAHQRARALLELPVHAAVWLPRVQPELHREARGPLEVVGERPVVEAAHVVAVRQRAQHLLEVSVDEQRAPVVARVRDARLRDVHGDAVARRALDGAVHALRVDGVVHVGHDLGGHARGLQPPRQHGARVVVDAPPVARRLARWVRPPVPGAQHRQLPLKLARHHPVVHHVPPPPVLHPLGHRGRHCVRQARALRRKGDVVVHQPDLRPLPARQRLERAVARGVSLEHVAQRAPRRGEVEDVGGRHHAYDERQEAVAGGLVERGPQLDAGPELAEHEARPLDKQRDVGLVHEPAQVLEPGGVREVVQRGVGLQAQLLHGVQHLVEPPDGALVVRAACRLDARPLEGEAERGAPRVLGQLQVLLEPVPEVTALAHFMLASGCADAKL
eukprot:CAMPEP_0202886300 /NCGR_PEP_ID=MMETSP1391-20130828/42103_1 /ASSEMBLY_ACC=CAM_ASM_000867 /TAXON_ID=1034604 /ORGANISM="Chlamydomonas leiostraca, Strain SAG 11-49" /LENGTH=543 /DNA_ID=CAMNT_0049569569 /DNA_START=1014 /DNA_END=2646 /DNA_ORIENTATION=-